MKELKLVEVDRVEEQEIEKILNKRKVRGVIKYLVYQKRFAAENNIQKKNLKNAKELVDEFEERMNTEIRQQEKLGKKRRIKLNSRTEKFRKKQVTREVYSKAIIQIE